MPRRWARPVPFLGGSYAVPLLFMVSSTTAAAPYALHKCRRRLFPLLGLWGVLLSVCNSVTGNQVDFLTPPWGYM